MGRTRPGHRRPGPLYSARAGPREREARSQLTLTLAKPPPPPPAAAAAGACAFRGSPPPRFTCSFFFKKILFVVFLFRRIFRGYFLIAISDPIFVLV